MAVSKIKAQVISLENLVEKMEKLVNEVRILDARIEGERGIVVDVEMSVGFSPEKVLQIARFKIMRAKETLAHFERPYTIRWHKAKREEEAADIPAMVQEQTRIIQRSTRVLNELKDTLQDVFR